MTQIPFSGPFFPLWWVQWVFLSPSNIELLALFWRLFGNRNLEHYLSCLDIWHYSWRNDLGNSVTDLGVNGSSYIAQLLIHLMTQIKVDFGLIQFYPLSFSCLLRATLSDPLCKMGHMCSPIWKSVSVLCTGTCAHSWRKLTQTLNPIVEWARAWFHLPKPLGKSCFKKSQSPHIAAKKSKWTCSLETTNFITSLGLQPGEYIILRKMSGNMWRKTAKCLI